MENKLVSMTDFVLNVKSKIDRDKVKDFSFMKDYQSIFDYARFLKKPLTIGMFIPTRQDGVILTEPIPKKTSQDRYPYELRDWNEAKEKVLFEGFEVVNADLGLVAIKKNGWVIMKCSKSSGAKWENIDSYPDIESLLGFEIKITESALKQIYG